MIEFLYDGSLEGLFTAIFYAYPYKDDCTINKLENDFVTNEFISSHPEYELELSRQLMPGIDETDGFYISRFKKK